MSEKPFYKSDAFLGEELVVRTKVYKRDNSSCPFDGYLRISSTYDYGVSIDVCDQEDLDALDRLINFLIDYKDAIERTKGESL